MVYTLGAMPEAYDSRIGSNSDTHTRTVWGLHRCKQHHFAYMDTHEALEH